MVIFGDEDNMVERFVEIDARVFLDGTLTSRRVFQLTGPGTRENLGFPGNLHLLTEGLKDTQQRPAVLNRSLRCSTAAVAQGLRCLRVRLLRVR